MPPTPKKQQPRHAITLTEVIGQQQELLLALAARTPRGQEGVEVGETAKGEPYVKSVQVYLHEGEGWARMCDRALGQFAYLRERLPEPREPRENGATK